MFATVVSLARSPRRFPRSGLSHFELFHVAPTGSHTLSQVVCIGSANCDNLSFVQVKLVEILSQIGFIVILVLLPTNHTSLELTLLAAVMFDDLLINLLQLLLKK